MATTTLRKIIKIDEEKCDGCGLCVPACAEGALQLENGKAKLISDPYCDALGASLGECQQGDMTSRAELLDDLNHFKVETVGALKDLIETHREGIAQADKRLVERGLAKGTDHAGRAGAMSRAEHGASCTSVLRFVCAFYQLRK